MMNKDVLTQALDKFSTPLYLFDESVLMDDVAHVRAMLPKRALLCFAMKANPFVVSWADSEVERIEVCSTGEMRICQEAGISMGKLVVSGVYKEPGLMLELMGGDECVCRYTVESVSQFEMLENTACVLGVRVPILIRLSSRNQFGLDEVHVRALLARAHKSEFVYPCGIQYFSGTQKTSGKRIVRELQKLDTFLDSIEHEQGIVLDEIEYGAGLAVEYFAEDSVACQEEDEQLCALGETLDKMRFRGKLVIELGRALSARCGTYATSVVDTKRNSGFNYAIVDGGMHQLTYYGHAMALQQPPCRVINKRSSNTPESWSIHGSLCTANDVLAKQITCNGLSAGDVVVFERVGAYCMTEGLSLFLSRDLPRVVLADRQGDLVQVRNRVETWTLNTSVKGI